MQNSHKEFRGPIPWISNGVLTSEARRSSGDDSGTTCEADLGRQTQRGAGAGGTGGPGYTGAVTVQLFFICDAVAFF